MNFSFLNSKNFLWFSDFELKLLGMLPGKFFASVVKTALCLLSTAFWGMIMLLERKCSYAFHVLRTLRKNLWVFGETIWTCTSNPNSSCPKQKFYKIQIFWKNQVFWQIQEFKWWFLDFGMKILAENFQQGFLDCNRCLYGNVLRFCCKFCFFSFGFWSDVPLDFWRNFHRWFVKIAFLCSERNFEKNNFENIKHVSKVVDSNRSFLLFWREFSRSIV